MKLFGGCLCGAIRYVVNQEPIGSGQCYCRDCQYSTGGGPATGFVVPESALRILSGEARVYETETHAGNKAQRLFCSTCGTPLFGRKSSTPGTVAVMAGSLDNPDAISPRAISWASSAPRWAHLNPKLKAYPKDIDI